MIRRDGRQGHELYRCRFRWILHDISCKASTITLYIVGVYKHLHSLRILLNPHQSRSHQDLRGLWKISGVEENNGHISGHCLDSSSSLYSRLIQGLQICIQPGLYSFPKTDWVSKITCAPRDAFTSGYNKGAWTSASIIHSPGSQQACMDL